MFNWDEGGKETLLDQSVLNRSRYGEKYDLKENIISEQHSPLALIRVLTVKNKLL